MINSSLLSLFTMDAIRIKEVVINELGTIYSYNFLTAITLLKVRNVPDFCLL